VPWGAVGPATAVGVCKPPHAPERGMGRPPRDTRYSTSSAMTMWFIFPAPLCLPCLVAVCACEVCLLSCWGTESPSPAKEGGISCGGSSNTSHNVMTDRSNSILDRERSAPGMSHVTRRHTHTSPRPYRRRAFRQGTLRHYSDTTTYACKPLFSSRLFLSIFNLLLGCERTRAQPTERYYARARQSIHHAAPCGGVGAAGLPRARLFRRVQGPQGPDDPALRTGPV